MLLRYVTRCLRIISAAAATLRQLSGRNRFKPSEAFHPELTETSECSALTQLVTLQFETNVPFFRLKIALLHFFYTRRDIAFGLRKMFGYPEH